ncbi:MAG: peptidylprolyl isomerase, partial [Gemmatimonadota bacterium]
VLSLGLNDPDPFVRQTAVTSVGRIGDRRGTRLLLPLLTDTSANVLTATFFAMGLMRDSAAVAAIIARVQAPDSLSAEALSEAATALARIGGSAAARFIESVLSGTAELSVRRRSAFIGGALQDGWKLGALMPSAAMIRFTNDTSVDLRSRALYSLGRLRVPAAGRAMLGALRDQTPMIREIAAKWLTKRFADTAGLGAPAVESELQRALDDELPGVRVNAVTSLATFADSLTTKRITPMLSDNDPNVRVAAVTALGETKGSAAIKALDGVMEPKNNWAMRRAALAALVKLDTATFIRRAAPWLAGTDFRDRMAALQGWGTLAPKDPTVFRNALRDPDVRVQAAALEAWRAAKGDTALLTAARARLQSADEGMRSAAATILRASATAADLDPLIAAWRLSLVDRESDARLAVLGTLGALARRDSTISGKLDTPARRVIFDRPNDPVVRAEVARLWPDLAKRWGEKWPIATGKTIDDYRYLVRTYLLAPTDPTVTIEMEGRGTVEVQLFAHEAPLTVANFLRLVDQHYFDGNRWHRVVPNFVVQDGDKTGTGNGGPGWSIRDEINRERYALPMLGMALSGADTGGSQWFINLSAQPHLDGQYTIFGKVTGSYSGLARIAQGDVIRSIHR